VPVIEVRREVPEDAPRVHAVQRAAFGRSDEADLVDALRRSTEPQLSLVAVCQNQLVGHVFFSPVHIADCPTAPGVAGLAPLGVEPDFQGRGAGGALVREGLRVCPALGWRAVFLLGDPGYYTRFGFELAALRGFHYESGLFDRGFQVRELDPGALAGCSGWVRYADAFDAL
jgi:putative acetyltransferase